MTPTPPSTTSSSTGGHSPDAHLRVVRKRNRVPLSCAPCRHRKLKCNRSNPCDNCVRRGDAASCSYAAPGTRKKNQNQAATSPDDMQNRIDRLEGLVLSLMTNGAESAGPTAAAAAISRSQSDSAGSSYPPDFEREDDNMIKEEEADDESDVEGVTNSLGILKVDVDKGKSMYLGDSHWHMVLADIAEVKTYFAAHKKDLEKKYEYIKQSKPSTAKDGPAFLFDTTTSVTDAELRAEIPSKTEVEKLVTRYFNSYDPAIYVVHAPSFHKQLQNHWQDPSSTSIVWLGLLYSVMTLAMQSYHKIGDEPVEWKGRTLELAAEFRLRTVQCLINSDYTKSSTFTIETLVLYVHGEYSGSWDAEVSIWVIVGMIARLAMRMGYHRDPSNFAGISPYQGEMRRRLWSFIRQMDVMFSFQLALPGMIRDSDCDASLPRNIFEDEFGLDTKVLPPSRPLTDPTPISYIITKAQITLEFGLILEEINAVSGAKISYDEVLKRDSRLRDIRSKMSPHLKLRPMEECTHEPANLLMQRFNLDIMWQKTMCVLHRKYIARARLNHRYTHSRRACVDASMEILRHQAKLHIESQPGGRMRTMKWFISSLTKHDYLLAAMIVCLDLHYDSLSEAAPTCPINYDKYFWTPAQRENMLQVLETSQQIWNESAEASIEAYKASNIIGVMLETIKAPKVSKPECPTTAEVFAQFDQDNLKPEHSAAMTLGMLSGGLSPNSAAIFNTGQSPRGTFYPNNYDITMGDSSTSTGLTPNFPMDPSNPFALNSIPSPFSAFGNTGTGTSTGFDNLDWEAWDTYIQNGNPIDPAFQFYPTTVEQSSNTDGQNQQPDPPSFEDGVFMGANTPGK